MPKYLKTLWYIKKVRSPKFKKGKNVLFDIDWQGADKIKKKN